MLLKGSLPIQGKKVKICQDLKISLRRSTVIIILRKVLINIKIGDKMGVIAKEKNSLLLHTKA